MRPFAARALAAAVTDFSGGITDHVIPALLEMREHDDTVADLFLTAMLEECPDEGELEDKLGDLAMQLLQSLPSFQRWAARTSERIEAQLRAQFEARVAAERAREVVHSLETYFTAKDDVPSLGALKTMNACTNVTTARYWLNRAYAGDTSADIFPDGNDGK